MLDVSLSFFFKCMQKKNYVDTDLFNTRNDGGLTDRLFTLSLTYAYFSDVAKMSRDPCPSILAKT